MPERRRQIADEHYLLRRIPPRPEFTEPRSDGSFGVAESAFNAKEIKGLNGTRRELSVTVRDFLDDPKEPLAALGDRPHHGLIEFRAAVPHSAGLDVEHEPVPDNPAHANIVGWAEGKAGKTQRMRQRIELAKADYSWVRQPQHTELSGESGESGG